MKARFFEEIEQKYMKQFPEQNTTRFHHIDKVEAYHKLLEKAMQRNAVVTEEEIIAYLGEEIYTAMVERHKAWDELYAH